MCVLRSAPGSSNADSRQQICDRGLPVNQRPPRESYLTHYWQSADRDPCPNDTQQLDDVSRYQTFTLLESQNLIEGGTTGLRTWPASFRLARYLSQHTGGQTSGIYFCHDKLDSKQR